MKAIYFEQFENSYIPHILKELYIEKVYDRYFKGKTDMTILDIGANIGLFTMFAYPHASKIYSVEPSKQHCDIMHKTFNFNQMYDKVDIVQKAIFTENKTMQFFHNENVTMFSLNKAVDDGKSESEDVEAITLETLFKEKNIEHVDFMKLDIEGAEVDVIGGSGFENVVDKIDSMVVEYHTWSNRNPSQIYTTLMDYGFEVEVIPADAKLFGAYRK